MTDLRIQIWRRILVSPWVFVPVTVAFGAFVIGLGIVSVAAFAIAVGAVVVRATVGFDKWKLDAEQAESARLLAELDSQLDKLAVRLRVDRDFRTKDSLSMARTAMKRFRTLAPKSELKFQTLEIGKQMDKLFAATVEQIEDSIRMFEEADRIAGTERDSILAKREKAVLDATVASQKLQQSVEQLETLLREDRQSEIQPLHDELERSILIAKRVDERMRELEPNFNELPKPQSE